MWIGSDLRGYGCFWDGTRSTYAHRFSYELVHGSIPEGREIDHTCHTPGCVNPDHLRLVTRKQNVENRAGARRDNSTGVRGVRRLHGRWQARLRHNGQDVHVGTYDTLEEAEEAAIAKRNELFTHNDADKTERLLPEA